MGSDLKTLGNAATNALPAAGAIAGGIGGGVLGAVGGPVGAYAGAVGGSALGGAAGEATKEGIQGKLSAPNIAKAGVGYGAMEAIAGPVASLAGKVIEATGAGIAKMFIPKSEAEAGIIQAYKAGTSFLDRVGAVLKIGSTKAPTTAASSAFDKGLIGTESMLGVQAKRAQTTLWDKLISPALKQSTEKINIPTFLKEAQDKIVAETNDPTRQKVLLNALKAIREDFKGVGSISLEQLQKYKEGWAEFVPEKAYKGQPIAGAVNDVRNTLAGMSREKIYNALGDNVKQGYLDYSNLFGITKLGQKAMTGVTSIIKGGTGTSIKNILEMVTIPVGTIGGQSIYKVGQGLEFLGKPGARTLRDALGIPLFGTGQGQSDTSMSSPTQSANTLPTQTPIQ